MAALLFSVAAGCGIGESSAPADAGDPLGAKDRAGFNVAPPDPRQFTSPEGLVGGFLAASAAGVDQVKAFLNEQGVKAWRAPSQDTQDVITVIRLTEPIRRDGEKDGRSIVRVDYQVVGQLTGGQLDQLREPAATPHRMTLYVKPYGESLNEWRIDDITGDVPPGLLISDDALPRYYRIQPIYFWNNTFTRLVPDLRYIKVIRGSVEARATTVVNMLIAGPSPMLGGVQRLRATKVDSVVVDNGAFKVQLNSSAITGDDKTTAAMRLLYQLQWSLALDDRPSVTLLVGNDGPWPLAANDPSAVAYNLAASLPPAPQVYDIKDEKVIPAPDSGKTPAAIPILAGRENKNVVSAAISRNNDLAAFVVKRLGARALQIVRQGAKTQAPVLQGEELGRPAWVPGSDVVLVPASGKIQAVSADTGHHVDITPRNMGPVTALSVSPDAGRIAFVADGRVHIAQLSVDGDGNIAILSQPLSLPLSATLVATGVAWTSVERIKVVGTEGDRTGGGDRTVAVMYEATADGVVATKTELKGINPSDVVAYPSTERSHADVYVLSPQGTYFGGTSEFPAYKAPFFAL